MKTLDISGTTTIAEAVRGLNGEPLAVMDGQDPLAVLLPVEGGDLETVSLSVNAQFLRIIESSRQRHAAEGGISSEEMRKRLGIPAPEQKEDRPVRRKRKAN
jgi:hypothetical protein